MFFPRANRHGAPEMKILAKCTRYFRFFPKCFADVARINSSVFVVGSIWRRQEITSPGSLFLVLMDNPVSAAMNDWIQKLGGCDDLTKVFEV